MRIIIRNGMFKAINTKQTVRTHLKPKKNIREHSLIHYSHVLHILISDGTIVCASSLNAIKQKSAHLFRRYQSFHFIYGKIVKDVWSCWWMCAQNCFNIWAHTSYTRTPPPSTAISAHIWMNIIYVYGLILAVRQSSLLQIVVWMIFAAATTETVFIGTAYSRINIHTYVGWTDG